MSIGLDQLVFDNTDADTLAASANVGAHVRAGDDGTLISHTTDGAREALDVFTELGQDEDSVHVSGDKGVMSLGVRNDAGTPLAADGDYIPFSMDATGALRVAAELSLTSSAEKAEDSAHSSGDIGNYILAVRADVRPTDANTDADGDYASLFVNDSGELYVKATDTDALLTTIDSVLDLILADTNAMVVDLAAIEVEQLAQGVTLDSILADTTTIAGDTTSIDATLTALSRAEDSVHTSGDSGIMSLAVRNDAGTALAADGDYIPLSTDAAGSLRVTMSGEDDEIADTALLNTQKTVTTTTGALLVSELADRKYLWVQNLGNKHTYIGAAGVTSANGLRLPPGSIAEFRLGSALSLHAEAQAGTQDLRIMEAS